MPVHPQNFNRNWPEPSRIATGGGLTQAEAAARGVFAWRASSAGRYSRQLAAWLSVLVCCGWLVSSSPADVVLGKVLPLRQPDGQLLQVRIWGDEFYSVVETLDGYTLVRDPVSRYICYAQLSEDGDLLLSTGVLADQPPPAGLEKHLRINAAAARAQAAAARADFERRQWEGPHAPPRGLPDRGPTTGQVLGLCLLIDFSDDPGTIPPAEVEKYCNKVGYVGYGNNGSVRDYFYDVSDNLLTYTNYVPASYYRALHPKSYYTDPNVPFGERARELILEALNYLEANGLDYAQFDADADGTVDALNCFYAGYSESAWAEGLWPHAGHVYFCADGVCTRRYQMTDMQNMLRLQTFCHENGHMLMGWPDLYDYDYDSTGVGQFCLMCYGTVDTNPCQPCAYMKYIAGWANTILLTSFQCNLPVPSDSNTIYKFPHPTAENEYYLIENRQRVGRDAQLPDDGLAIWHVDTLGSNNHQQQTPELHYRVTLVQADGKWDLERNRNYGDSTDLWPSLGRTQCTPETSPNTNWWSGEVSNLHILMISPSAPTMSFCFLDGPDCNYNYIPDYVDMADCDGSFWCLDCNANGQIDECDVNGGWSYDCNGNGIPDECEAGTTSPDDNHDGVPDECEWMPADLNCDGLVDKRDINPFVLLLQSEQLYLAALPDCVRINGDINGDGSVNFGDIRPFIDVLLGRG